MGGTRTEAVDKDDVLKKFCDVERERGTFALGNFCRLEGNGFRCVRLGLVGCFGLERLQYDYSQRVRSSGEAKGRE